MAELARSAAIARFAKLRLEGEENPDRSWQRVTCHLVREDVPWAALPLTMWFGDARPRGASGMDYVEDDE